MTAQGSPELFRADRLLAFSDGVFGVAITLLVIDLHLPSIATENEPALLQALLRMGLVPFASTVLGELRGDNQDECARQSG
jgi:uncharacterized membrane protein